MLLVDLKGAFDHISRSCQLCTIEGMRAEGDLIRWTESFMSDRRLGPVIDGHQSVKTVVDIGVPQG